MTAPFALEPLLAAVRKRSTGIGSHVHGDRHWRTVAVNGLSLAEAIPDVDRNLVFLFALLHDTMRENDNTDPDHGRRAAVFAGELQTEGLLGIAPDQLRLLRHACDEHADGKVSDHTTVGVCWDADRLDLPRVGVTPTPDLFSSDVARNRPYRAADPPDWPELYLRL